MTHILIPIEDIEETIKITMLALQETPSNQVLNNGLNFWTFILSKYKQISLDEKDIIDASKIAAIDYNKFENGHELDKFTIGYTQALKDLK